MKLGNEIALESGKQWTFDNNVDFSFYQLDIYFFEE